MQYFLMIIFEWASDLRRENTCKEFRRQRISATFLVLCMSTFLVLMNGNIIRQKFEIKGRKKIDANFEVKFLEHMLAYT